MIGICWTNTLPNLPPWGASDPRVGNNPLVVAVPRPSGPVVLDMAMSQFSYGMLASYRRRANSCLLKAASTVTGGLRAIPQPSKSRSELCQSVTGRGQGFHWCST